MSVLPEKRQNCVKREIARRTISQIGQEMEPFRHGGTMLVPGFSSESLLAGITAQVSYIPYIEKA